MKQHLKLNSGGNTNGRYYCYPDAYTFYTIYIKIIRLSNITISSQGATGKDNKLNNNT